jgi:hypothetical protein
VPARSTAAPSLLSRTFVAGCYVYCEPGFAQNAAVINGFSDFIVELWGDAGRHARSSPGQGPSPLNVPVIVDAIAAIT